MKRFARDSDYHLGSLLTVGIKIARGMHTQRIHWAFPPGVRVKFTL